MVALHEFEADRGRPRDARISSGVGVAVIAGGIARILGIAGAADSDARVKLARDEHLRTDGPRGLADADAVEIRLRSVGRKHNGPARRDPDAEAKGVPEADATIVFVGAGVVRIDSDAADAEAETEGEGPVRDGLKVVLLRRRRRLVVA